MDHGRAQTVILDEGALSSEDECWRSRGCRDVGGGRLALMDAAEREEALEGLDQAALMHDPFFWLRPSQLLPLTAGDSFDLAIAMAGRGWGKSRVLSEWVRHKVRTLPAGARGALVAHGSRRERRSDSWRFGDFGVLLG